MIICVFTKLFAWMYGVELSEHARMAFVVFSLLESIIVSAFVIVGYFVGYYESQNMRCKK